MDSSAIQAEIPAVSVTEKSEAWLEPFLWQKHTWSYLLKEIMLWREADLLDTELPYEVWCD